MDFYQFLWVSVFGALLGIAELISRYRDDPSAVAQLPASYFYVVFNALIGVMALYVILIIQPSGLVDTTPSDDGDDLKIKLYQILVAGFGGAAFFRASIAKTKVGDMEIGVGPSFVIDAFLGATDRAIDRRRAEARAKAIPDLMRFIPAEFAALELTDFCVSGMQNLPAAEEKTLKTRVAAYAAADEAMEEVRAMLIGFAITEYVGFEVLKQAAAKLETEIAAAREKREQLEPGADIAQNDLLSRVQAARQRHSGLPADSTDTISGGDNN